MFRGMFEDRIEKIINEIKENKNIEFKEVLKIDYHLKEERKQHLAAQMRYLLDVGKGEAVYIMGVKDSGAIRGLNEIEFRETLSVLETIAKECGAEVSKIEKFFEDGKLMSRIPESVREKLNDSAKNNALATAGCEIRFNIKSGSAKIILQSVDSRFPLLEVYQGNFFISSHLVKDKPTEINISLPENLETLARLSEEYNLPFDSKLTRVILPYGKTKLIDIEGDITPPEEGQTPKVKYLAYGSSITHGLTAIRPTGTYAMKTAYLLGVDLINLGL